MLYLQTNIYNRWNVFVVVEQKALIEASKHTESFQC